MDKTELYTLPNTNIQLLAPPAELDFFDQQTIRLSRSVTPLEAWGIMTSRPSPVLKWAFRIRDFISSLFGVKKISGFSTASRKTVSVGQKLDFFLVEHVSNDVLSLSARDSHLDVLTCISRNGKELTITSSVKTHKIFGRIYMLPVAPAHKVIVRSFLRHLKKQCSISALSPK
ncbi:MAG: DUF2867 domain-containing protein [Rhizobiaceae bacterium]|nr:DUF2867 domain-containing protein [Rhizobiaceae bacterium]